MLRSLVARVLTEEGFAALEAPDGAAALELIESIGGEVALVIADIVMPRLTGIALLELLAVSHPGLPVLLMSGYSEAELADRGIALPCATLLKPFSSATLMAEVRRCLEGAA